jgi:hypothetical protein
MSLTSIIITTHNRPQFVGRAIESAWTAGTNVEVIVVDDASTDETQAVCQSLPRIKYVRIARNQGVAGARNVGLLASSGEYVTFLDDDDQRLPGSIDEQVKLLEGNNTAGLVYAQAIWGNQSGQPTTQLYPATCPTGDTFWDLLGQNFIPCGAVVFRRSCLNAVGLLDDSLAGLDDWDVWLRIAELYPIIALEKPVMIWRRSTPVSDQGTSRAAELVSQCVRQFHRSWMKLPRAANASRDQRAAAWRHFSANMAEHLAWEAARCLQHGRTVAAARNVFTLLRLCPLAAVRVASSRNVFRALRALVRRTRNAAPSYSNLIDHPYIRTGQE